MMKPKYLALLCFLIFFSFGNVFAQPANDTCGTAQLISVGSGTCNSILYTNVAATIIGNPPTPPCWLPNTMSNTVWFKFVATTPDVELSTNFAGTLADTQIAIYSGSCGALTLLACQEDINTAAGFLHTDVILHGLTVGNTYLAAVDGKGNATGTFGICAQQTAPVGPILPVQDCVSSQTLCTLGNISVADGAGGIGTTQEGPSCFLSGERSSNWYSFTAATNGTLCFTINPNSGIDYDFAVYNTTNGCPGMELSCNWEPDPLVTGLGCVGIQCNTCLAVFAGQTYSILVDRFTAASTSGFTLNFAGSTTSFTAPTPTFTATTVCLGSPTQFTNTTNGNFIYNWNFGDGFTSNLENPTHTFATANAHNVTLLLTTVPGGCQNSAIKVVTVISPPTVDAGVGGNVCSGNCITLAGSTNAVGSTGLQGFTNSASFTIPDDNATGVLSPITVSGIVPTVIDPTSIASVCINLVHPYDNDLDIFLRCPDGTQVELSSDNGFGANYTGTCFTPAAIIPITSGSSPFSGDFIPEQPFSTFNGCPANGIWQLFVKDDFNLDAGNILNWTITFNNNVPPFTWSPTTGMTNANSLTPTVCPTVTTIYTLTANNPGSCTSNDTVTVTVGSGASASINYSAAAYCNTDTPKTVTLTGTGAYTGGTYSSTTGLTLNAATGQITPLTSIAGTYTVTYTVPAIGGCPAFSVTTSVIIRTQPDAGADGAVNICAGDTTPINLFSLITGEQSGGIWTRTSGTAGTLNPATGIFTPAAATNTSTFNYTVTGLLPCSSDTSAVSLTVSTPLAPIINCGTSTTASVQFNWAAVTGATNYTISYQVNANPIVNTGAIGNLLTYSVSSLAAGDSVSVTVTPTGPAGTCLSAATQICTALSCAPASASINYSAAAYCNTDTPKTVTLTGTGAYTGGTYSSTTGLTLNAATGQITPLTSIAGTYTVTYTVPAIGGCPAFSVTTSVIIRTQPDAGADGAVNICAGDTTPINLFSLITGEQSGGIWTRTSGTAGTLNPATGVFTPAAATNTSTFNYTVTGLLPCSSDTSAVSLTVSTPLAPIINCGTSTTASVQFNWAAVTGATNYTISYQVNANPIVNTGAIGNLLTYSVSSLAAGDSVSVTVTPTGPAGTCLSAATQICTALSCAPASASINYSAAAYCNTDTPKTVTLTGTGAYTGGTYSSTTGLTLNAATGQITPLTSIAGTYTVTYTVPAIGGCPAFSVTTSVIIRTQPDAGADGAVNICAGDTTPINLFSLITGEQSGGIWTRTSGTVGTLNPATGVFTPAAATNTSTFNYTVTGLLPCSSDTSAVSLTVSTPLAPIINCGTSTTASVQFNWAAVTGATGYTISYQVNANPIVNTGAIGNLLTYSVSSLAAGDSVSVTVTPTGPAGTCLSAATQICTALSCAPATANINYSAAAYCNTDTPKTVTLTGTGAYTGGTYSSTTGLTLNAATGQITPLTSIAGTYTVTYTVPAIGGCPAFSVTTSVIIRTQPDAGADGAVNICAGDTTPINLFSLITGEQSGGIWTRTSGTAGTLNPATGVFTPAAATNTSTFNYTVTGLLPCSSDTSAVSLTVSTPLAPIINCGTSTTASVQFNWAAVTGATNYTISYQVNANPIVNTGPIGNLLTYSVSSLAAGDSVSVTVTPTGPAGTCLSAATQICTALSCAPATANINYSAAAYCNTDTPKTVTLTGTGAYTGGTYSSTTGLTLNAATGQITPLTSIAGTYTVTYTVPAIGGCAPVTVTATVTIADPPATPNLTAAQPTCTSATGGIMITAVAGLIYSFDGSPYSSTLIYNGLAAGSSHNVTAQNAVGCISAPAVVSLNPQPLTPATPNLTTAQPTCTSATGGIMITAVAGLIYSFDGSPYSSTLIYNGLAAGSSHNVTAQNTVGCISAPAVVTLNPQPVTPVAVATPNLQSLCSGNTTGIALSAVSGTIFTWTVVQNNVTGAIAGSGNNISQSLIATGNITGHATYTITPFANGCTGLPITVTITVNPLPVVTANPTIQTICSGDQTNIILTSSSVGNTSFNWTVLQTGISGATSGSGSSISQILTATDIVPGTADYTITPVRNGCNGATVHAIITVNPKPQVANPLIYNLCDGDTANIFLASSVSGTGFTWTISQSNVIGASSGTGSIINQPLTLTGSSPGSIVYTVTPIASGCQGNPTNLIVNVNPLPQPVIKDGIICVEQSSNTTLRTYILDSGLNDSGYDFQWTRDNIVILGANSSTYEASLSGTYSVIASNSLTSCVSQEVFAQVNAAFIGDGIVVSVSDAFTGNASIVVTVPIGTGRFYFQLDNGPLQESNVFGDVPGGPHTVYVIDVNGCTNLQQKVTVIDYPKFFTPNGDGYNDRWNIFALREQERSKIFIYDRYGKLIKEISPKGIGWDGTLNGDELPATDYWFTVDYNESGISKTFKSHFALKR